MIASKYFTNKEGIRYRITVYLYYSGLKTIDTPPIWHITVTKKKSKKQPHKRLCYMVADYKGTNIYWDSEPEHIPIEWIREVQKDVIRHIEEAVHYVKL